MLKGSKIHLRAIEPEDASIAFIISDKVVK
jgi:hypothetical protein